MYEMKGIMIFCLDSLSVFLSFRLSLFPPFSLSFLSLSLSLLTFAGSKSGGKYLFKTLRSDMVGWLDGWL